MSVPLLLLRFVALVGLVFEPSRPAPEDAPLITPTWAEDVVRGSVSFRLEDGEEAPSLGAIHVRGPGSRTVGRGWFHDGGFVLRLRRGTPSRIMGFAGGPWVAVPGEVTASDLRTSPEIVLHRPSEADLARWDAERNAATKRVLDASRDPPPPEAGPFVPLAGTVRLVGVWRRAHPSIVVRPIDPARRPPLGAWTIGGDDLRVEATEDDDVVRWRAGRFLPGVYEVGLEGVTLRTKVELSADRGTEVHLAAPAEHPVVLHLRSGADRVPESIEWNVEGCGDFPESGDVAGWICGAVHGTVAASSDGAFRFRAPEGALRIRVTGDPPLGSARIDVRPGPNEATLTHPLAVRVVLLEWNGTRENWAQTWDFSLWPLDGSGTIFGGTGATYVVSEPGRYLVTREDAEDDDLVPVEPFEVTLERGPVQEIWVERKRVDGAPIDVRRSVDASHRGRPPFRAT
ncbi:MAG: hypothetical protein ACF8XB_05445 [Planctomycetota bacterium JB042]